MIYKSLKSEDFEIIPIGENVTARVVSLENKKDKKIYIFRTSSGSYSCLIQVNETSVRLPDINGIYITYQNFTEPGSEMMPFIQLECNYNSYLQQFVEILKEVISDFDNGVSDVIVSVIKIINKWKHFLSEPGIDILNEEDILGLLGELLLFEKLAKLSPGNCAGYWSAYNGGEDFIFGSSIIEVKTTFKSKHEHVINGIDQLKLIPAISKYILSLLISKVNTSDSITLPGVMEKIGNLLFEYPESSDLFMRKVKARGYDARDSESYSEYKYKLIKGGLFIVDKAFPKLTTAQLSESLNVRVSKVNYLIDIEGLSCVDFNTLDLKKFI